MDIKFRAKRKLNGDWVYGSLISIGEDWCQIVPTGTEYDEIKTEMTRVITDTIGQFSGVQDKHGVDVYKGDIIRVRRPYRSTQTHTGDNIPNGSYTEPMEPEIEEQILIVSQSEGWFCVDMNGYSRYQDETEVPLNWIGYTYNEEDLKDAVAYSKPDADFWDDPEEGDLSYLLQQYKLKDLDELLEYIRGFEIIGNIHDNPELL